MLATVIKDEDLLAVGAQVALIESQRNKKNLGAKTVDISRVQRTLNREFKRKIIDIYEYIDLATRLARARANA